MMRWAFVAVVVVLALLVGGALYLGLPFYERVSPFTAELTDITERARVEQLPDEEIVALLEAAARRHKLDIPKERVSISRPEPGTVHVRLVVNERLFGKDGPVLTMDLEARRP